MIATARHPTSKNRPVVFDAVAVRLIRAGLPDPVASALLLAVLPSHVAELGGRRLAARTAAALRGQQGRATRQRSR